MWSDNFVVTVSPQASGEWLLTLCKEYDNGEISLDTDGIMRIFGVPACRIVSTEKRAIKYAYKMLAAVREADKNRKRKSFEVR